MGIELISLLGGAIARLLTWGSEYLTKRQENTHELALLEKQMELEQQRALQKQDELALQGEIAVEANWSNALVEASKPVKSGSSFIDSLAAAVRPVLTFWWCLVLYTIYKVILIVVGIQEGVALANFANIVVSEFDRAVVGSILSFYFLDRRLRSVSGGKS